MIRNRNWTSLAMASDVTAGLPPRSTVGMRWLGSIRPRRAGVAALLLCAMAAPGHLGEITREMVIAAYLQVSVFVAATLLLFYGAERFLRFDIRSLLNSSGVLSVPLAAALGAAPGCGGAVIVVAAYSAGHVRFGAVVAALTATMGDAAFLLIATRPDAAAVVLPLAFLVGIVSGWAVNSLFPGIGAVRRPGGIERAAAVGETRLRDYACLALCVPGLAIGILLLLQVELEGALGTLATILGIAGTLLGLAVWMTSSFRTMSSPDDSPTTRMAEETSFISVYVIVAFLLYEYLVAFGGLDLKSLFSSVGVLLPLVGVLIGFIPGCGPQVLVTSLYISGAIPFAALVGNAISNDGDALFPAIAVDSRAAVLATLVSAIPALVVAYGFFFLAPGFMN